jgi:hypothetical protein
MVFLLLKPDASPSRLCVAASAERGRLSMTIKTVSLSNIYNSKIKLFHAYIWLHTALFLILLMTEAGWGRAGFQHITATALDVFSEGNRLYLPIISSDRTASASAVLFYNLSVRPTVITMRILDIANHCVLE